MSSTIEVSEPSPGVKVVTLSRPDAANALNTAMGEELLALWTALAKDASVRVAVAHFAQAVHTVLERQGLGVNDVDLFIPHQANIRMLQSLANRLGVDFDQKFFITIDKYANISSASSAIALDEAIRGGRIKPAGLVCITVFGGGLTWGAALIQF